ncbi:hypothetical protein KP509_25G054200 [Ceratopteris richardii]|uniref:DUF4470 domain-containing protein n=1 Tax=Ceratopteris richardii TaxID=49495 RepID=A0A8T2RQI0_CERRI|nr:hypothetical protein KP509_25G054200 [Ceratopteris richardii]
MGDRAGNSLSRMAEDMKISKLELAEKIIHDSIKESERSLGSSINGAPMDHYVCANWSTSGKVPCSHVGVIKCTSCGLVSYCSQECKIENSADHSHHCRLASVHRSEPLLRGNLKAVPPQERKRALVKVGSDFIWGNIPAYNILPRNVKEGGLPHDLSLCFCASGDLRNVIETVCQLPEKFLGQVTIYINDYNPIIMARNFLMLKLLQTYGFDALDLVITLWYSAAMTLPQSIVVDGMVIHAIKHIVGSSEDSEIVAHFQGPSKSSLYLSDGFKLGPVLAEMSRSKLPMQAAFNSRMAKLKSGLKSHYKIACLHPSHQVAWKEFHERGIFLPFGAFCEDHSMPNKFLFHPSGAWLPHADANPFSGWDITSVMATGSHQSLPDSDLFGSLFFHVRGKIVTFLNKISTSRISFKLSCKQASEMAKDLALNKVQFFCIDTSNLADLNYCGLSQVLHDWGPLLDTASEFEPTLITYFMNWLYNMKSSIPDEAVTLSKLTWSDINSAVSFMNERGYPCAQRLKNLLALGNENGNLSILDYFHDFSSTFDDYLESVHAGIDAKRVGVFRRKKHLIVPPRLSVEISDFDGIPGKTASYDQCYYDCMIGDATFTERFVEWGPQYL